MLIAFAHIIVIDIKISLFRDGHAGMAQNLTEGVNVHTIHQASFCEIVPQTMGSVLFIQSRPSDIFTKIAFKIADTDGTAVFLDGE